MGEGSGGDGGGQSHGGDLGSQVLGCSEDTDMPKSALGFLGAATSVAPLHANP